MVLTPPATAATRALLQPASTRTSLPCLSSLKLCAKNTFLPAIAQTPTAQITTETFAGRAGAGR